MKVKAEECRKIVSRHAKEMLEGLAWTHRTGKEYGFCADGRKVIKRCRGKKCEVFFYIPKYKMKDTLCFHTHPDGLYPAPSDGDYEFFKWAEFATGCITNIKGDTVCIQADPKSGHIKKKKGRWNRKGQCEKNLVLEPVLGPGGYRKLWPWQVSKRVKPRMVGKYTYGRRRK